MMDVETGKEQVLKEGWLMKQGGRYKSWKKRYFVVRSNRLVYYKDTKQRDPLGEISFHTITTIEESDFKDGKKKGRCFFRINVTTERSSYLLGVESGVERQAWMLLLRKATGDYVRTKKAARQTMAPARASGESKTKRPFPRAKSMAINLRAEVDTEKSILKRGSVDGLRRREVDGKASTETDSAGTDEQFDEDDEDDLEDAPAQIPDGEGESRAKREALAMARTRSMHRAASRLYNADSGASSDARGRTEQEETEASKELFDAAKSNSAAAVRIRMELGASAEWKNPEEGMRTCVHVAAACGNADALKYILAGNSHLVNCVDTQKWTPLLIASHAGHEKAVQVLLEAGANVNAQSVQGISPLMAAVVTGHGAVANLLMEKMSELQWPQVLRCCVLGDTEAVTKELEVINADFVEEETGLTTLHLAAVSGCAELVNYLLEHGAAHIAGALDRQKKTPLHYAAAAGKMACVAALLNKGVHIDAADVNDKTAAHQAAGLGHADALSLLVDRGCNTTANDKFGFTPLHYAAMHGHVLCCKLLLQESSVRINALNAHGISPLYLAVHSNRVECANLLLIKGADVTLAEINGKSPLHEACRRGSSGCVSLLLSQGLELDVDGRDVEGLTPLMYACMSGCMESVQLLLSRNADAQLLTKTGKTMLALALEHNSPELMEVLVEEGRADPNATSNGVTPLFIAASKGFYESVELLLQLGSDISFANRWGLTPLLKAVSNGHDSVVQLLLQWGADPNYRTPTGWCALQEAAALNRVESLMLLLDAGAVTNVCNEDGLTPLHEAAANGHFKCLSLLLNAGADVDVVDANEETPIKKAALSGKLNCVMLLLSYGAAVPNLCVRVMRAGASLLVGSSEEEEQEVATAEKLDTCQKELAKAGEQMHALEDKVVGVEEMLARSNTEGELLKKQLEGVNKALEAALQKAKEVEEKGRQEIERLQREWEGKESCLRKEMELFQLQSEEREATVELATAEAEHYRIMLEEQKQEHEADKAAFAAQLEAAKKGGSGSPARASAQATPSGAKSEGQQAKVSAADQALLARQYLNLVQKLLSAEGYRKFQNLLRDYKKKNMAIDDLIVAIDELFGRTYEMMPALEGFITFVPAQGKQQYFEFCDSVKKQLDASAQQT